MIEFKDITKIYAPAITALEEISFKIENGEFLVIAGRSGAGKTTLLKLVLAEEAPTNGQIFLCDQDICEVSRKELSYLRRRIGAIFQNYRLLENRTVYENIAFALEAIGADDEEIEKHVPQVLEIVGLAEMIDRFPRQLSAGQKQRTAIARALIHRPEIILADEPTGNLDHHNTMEIIKLLLKINELGTTVLLATHNKDVIRKLKTRTILLKEGKLEKDAKGGEVIL